MTPETQVWEQCVPGTDVPVKRVRLEVGPDGRALVHEAILAQLFDNAGWERVEVLEQAAEGLPEPRLPDPGRGIER